ncbi:hypothetical protein [Haloarchaeobius baliensis]|uniref:hypothetical protein n=1 Tax=Haloarchaeobius baliensis TaxID=1670458 RepID=UPI003F8809AE
MRRRQVLATLPGALAASGGCLSSLGGGGSGVETLEPVEDPPDWLGTDRDCSGGHSTASLYLWNAGDSVSETTAVADYADLSDESKLVVRFAVEHVHAETCSDDGARRFITVLRDLDELALEPYRDEHLYGAESTAIHASGTYYDLEMDVYDMELT